MFNTKEVQFAEKPLLKPVFFGSAIFIISFVLLSLIFKKEMSTGLQNTLSFIGSSFGWFYLLSVSLFVTLCFILIVSLWVIFGLGPRGHRPISLMAVGLPCYFRPVWVLVYFILAWLNL